jgi:SAM-dependent methyltransferase
MPVADFFYQQIPAFEQQLRAADPVAVSGQPYPVAYLQHILQHRRYFLEIYARVLETAFQSCHKPMGETTFLDYGCGNGLLGLFAAFCGCRQVFLQDIDPHFTEAAQALANQLRIPVTVITGDLIHTKEQIRSIQPDVVAGTDVIEHIYRLGDFLATWKQLNPHITVSFSTAANPHHPIKRRRIMALQRKDEWIGGQPGDDVLFGQNAHPSYRSMREQLIREAAPDLNDADLKQLVSRTRGLIKEDILLALKRFQSDGQLPSELGHPTNTCNPLTGSWTEHLIPIEAYRAAFDEAGFSFRYCPGHFDVQKTGWRKQRNQLLNRLIPAAGLRLAPYIILTGTGIRK